MATDEAKKSLADLWQQVVERWDDKAIHDVLLDHARVSALLPEAAALYRSVKEDAEAPEERRKFAEKRLAAVAFVAMQALDGARSAPTQGLPRWATYLVVVVSAAVSIWAMKQVLKP